MHDAEIYQGYIFPKNRTQNYTGGIILWVGIFLTVTPVKSGKMLISASQAEISSQEVHIFGQVLTEVSGQVCKEFCSRTIVVGIFGQAQNSGQACMVKVQIFLLAFSQVYKFPSGQEAHNFGQAWNFCG